MEKQFRTAKAENLDKTGVHCRSLAKDIAELALFLDLTEPTGVSDHVEPATTEIANGRRIPATTLKRCASEARALVEFAHASDAIDEISAQAGGSEPGLRHHLSAWLDETNLTAVLKQRALRLNRSRGGRPPTTTRTLRAVEELVALARAGRPGAVDELRSIRALIGGA